MRQTKGPAAGDRRLRNWELKALGKGEALKWRTRVSGLDICNVAKSNNSLFEVKRVRIFQDSVFV